MLELGEQIEAPYSFGRSDIYEQIAGLSQLDYTRLVRILIRARVARPTGIVIPLDKLLAELPI